MPDIEIEVVFALPGKQSLKSLCVEDGVTVAEAVARSGLMEAFPDHDLMQMTLGVWGSEVENNRIVKAGDRIEIYRPLRLDPREARRKLALSGRTMSQQAAKGRGKVPDSGGFR